MNVSTANGGNEAGQYDIIPLSKGNFTPESPDAYERRQEVKRVYRRREGRYVLIDCAYTEDRSLRERREIAADIAGGKVSAYGVMSFGRVLGFITLKRELTEGYMILKEMHVAASCRGQAAV